MNTEQVLRLKRRNERIIKRYLELKDKKYKGKVQAYSDAKIWFMLSEEFSLAPAYLEKLVFNRVTYKYEKKIASNQTSLFE